MQALIHGNFGGAAQKRVYALVGAAAAIAAAVGPLLGGLVTTAVLRRPIGGPDVMRAQLEALLVAAGRPNVRLQIVPFTTGGHSAAGGAFTILWFPDRELPDVIYIEQLTSALYLDKRDDVEHYLARHGTPVCRGRPTRPYHRNTAQSPQRDLITADPVHGDHHSPAWWAERSRRQKRILPSMLPRVEPSRAVISGRWSGVD